MTEEEINKKAEKHCDEVLCDAHEKCNEVIKCRDWRSRRAGYFCGYEQALKDFEKENAELESDFRICEKNADTYYDQFTKAAEIIKKLKSLYFSPVVTDEILAEVEQFLSEVEK